MNFTDSLSLCSGLKLNKPTIQDLFFPIVPKKYITFCSENHGAKQWDHFQEYIDLINPYLLKEEIKIIEIGSNDLKFHNISSVKNITNGNHWSYILKNSLMHIGPENFMSQLCLLHKVPFIALFSNTNPEYSIPSWGDFKNKTFLMPDLKGKRPSFSSEESPKSINTISAESAAFETLKMLNINNEFNKFDVFYTGSNYHYKLIEIVPDFTPDDNFFPRSLLNIRMDYLFNQENIIPFANKRKISIVSDKEIDIELLLKIKPSLEKLFLKVDQDSNEDYAKKIKAHNIPMELVCKDGCDLPKTRLKFFDWKVPEEMNKSKKDLDIPEDLCDTTRYKSSKHIFSKDGKFSSRSAYEKGIKSHEDQLIIDDAVFWKDHEHYKLYNLNKNE